jgi:DNA-binding NarL/FixJ family response regulator
LLTPLEDIRVVAAMPMADTSVLKGANPNVVLLDFGLENGDSLAVVRQVGEDLPECRVIMLDLLPSHEDIMDVVHAGVSGFIMKDASLDDLVNTIRSVARGGKVLPPQMTNTLFSQIARDAIANGDSHGTADGIQMTQREREVINLISEGMSNKKIAAELYISIHTVKSHVRNIMEKLALHTRLQIAAWAHHGEDVE